MEIKNVQETVNLLLQFSRKQAVDLGLLTTHFKLTKVKFDIKKNWEWTSCSTPVDFAQEVNLVLHGLFEQVHWDLAWSPFSKVDF